MNTIGNITDIGKLGEICNKYIYDKIENTIKLYNLEMPNYTLKYLDSESKQLCDNLYSPKNHTEAVAFLYSLIIPIIDTLMSRYMESKTFKFNGASTRSQYEEWSIYIDTSLIAISENMNDPKYNYRLIPNEKIVKNMLLLYNLILYHIHIFDQIIAQEFNYKFKYNWSKLISTITYNPFWNNMSIEYKEILNKKFQVEDEEEKFVFVKNENAVEIELSNI